MPTVRVHHFPQSPQQPQVIREVIKEGPGISQADVLAIAVKAVEIYAARHPRPPHVTITQAAHMLGRSRPTVGALMKRHKIKLNGCGAIAIEDVDRMLAAND